ncbi:SRPBCC family protein [soil metagenome]
MTLVLGSHIKSIEIDAPREKVWSCFSQLDLRHRWFRIPGPRDASEHELDFRVGGLEVTRGSFMALDNAEAIETRTRFIDIVEPSRILSTYELDVDRLRSVSIIAVQLTEIDGGTRVDYDEQYTFVDPTTADAAVERREREGGTRLMLNGLKVTAES